MSESVAIFSHVALHQVCHVVQLALVRQLGRDVGTPLHAALDTRLAQPALVEGVVDHVVHLCGGLDPRPIERVELLPGLEQCAHPQGAVARLRHDGSGVGGIDRGHGAEHAQVGPDGRVLGRPRDRLPHVDEAADQRVVEADGHARDRGLPSGDAERGDVERRVAHRDPGRPRLEQDRIEDHLQGQSVAQADVLGALHGGPGPALLEGPLAQGLLVDQKIQKPPGRLRGKGVRPRGDSI